MGTPLDLDVTHLDGSLCSNRHFVPNITIGAFSCFVQDFDILKRREQVLLYSRVSLKVSLEPLWTVI